jgi:hypothetical protein
MKVRINNLSEADELTFKLQDAKNEYTTLAQ